jgi:RHS repeat-associated protein
MTRALTTGFGPANYLYDGPDVIEELDNSGNVLARYNQIGVDEPLSELRSGTTSYYEQDGLGSVTSLSNSAGALANTYSYDSYGKLSASTGTVTNPFQYTGREFDPETGLYYNRARYYDESGRFLSEDPLGFGGGADFYIYAENSPANYRDPFGLQALPKPSPGPQPVPPPGPILVPPGVPEPSPWPSVGGVLGVIGTILALEGHTASEEEDTIPPEHCGNDECDKLLKEIYRYMNTIRGRIVDLLTDPLNLYNLAFSSPNSSLPPGSGTWMGHQQQVQGWQQGLRNLLEEARKKGCRVPPGAWGLASRPIPSQPRGN